MNRPAHSAQGDVSLRIATDHPALAGHFPRQPIVPGVVLLDEVLHAIGGARAGTARWRLETVKFHRIVPAGQSLRLQYRTLEGDLVRFELRAADGVVVSGMVRASAGGAGGTDESAP